jgi:hypothetical protein
MWAQNHLLTILQSIYGDNNIACTEKGFAAVAANPFFLVTAPGKNPWTKGLGFSLC